MMHLLRCMFFFSAHFQFEYQVQHLPGRDNLVADALSRNRLDTFHSLLPQAPHSPTAIPQALAELLLDPSLTWTSPRWKSLFASTLRMASPNQPGSPTLRGSGSISPSVGSTISTPSSGPSTQPAYLQRSWPSRDSSPKLSQHTSQQ